MKKLLIIPLLMLVLSNFSVTKAASLRLEIEGGVSKQVGQFYDDFNWGFDLGGDIFFYLDNNVLLGIRVAYNRWTPSDSDLVKDFTGLVNGNVSGHAFSWEFIPTFRLTTDVTTSPVNLFLQGGAGLYVINNKTTITGTTTGGIPLDKTFGSGSRGRFGVQMGGGFAFGNPEFISIDVFSLYNIVFIGGESSTFKYFVINLGLGIGI
jgi:hypothetical protein